MAITATIQGISAAPNGFAITVRMTNGTSIDYKKNWFFAGPTVDTKALKDAIDADVLTLGAMESELKYFLDELGKGTSEATALITAVEAEKAK